MTLNRRILVAAPVAGVMVVAVVVLLAGWFSGDSRPLGFPLDDAWIHMVYGRNLASTGLLAYNDVATTGATSPLWAGLVGLAHVIGAGDVEHTIVVVYVLGCAFLLVAIVLAYRLTVFVTTSRFAGVAAGTIVAVSGPFAMSAFSGMEVALTAALVLAAVDASLRAHWTRAGVWLALAALARPEVAIVSVACFAFAASAKMTTGRERAIALVRLSLPSVLIGTLVVGYALWATGRPLPATFYMKQEASLAELPGRLHIIVRGLLGDVPPFATGLAYLAFLGLFLRGGNKDHGVSHRVFPLACGVLLVLVNALLVQPYANVFYHLRYVLPAVPLMIVGAVSGAHRLGLVVSRRFPRFALAPLGFLALIALIEALPTIRRHGARLHNDTRNIEEVQRALGTWVATHTEPGTWIATGDAGAVRYFGQRPTVDVMGLNTPELYWQPGWRASHPVAAFVMMPCWFQPRDPAQARIVVAARTAHYTVTHAQCMREQWIVTCTGKKPLELAFTGMREFTVTCVPGGLRESR